MSEMIDYIMITSSYPPIIGGVERHVYEVHKALLGIGLKGKIVVLRQQPAHYQKQEDVIWLAPTKLFGVIPKTLRLKQAFHFLKIFMKYPHTKLHFHDFGTIYPILPLLKVLGLLDKTFLTFHGWEGIYPPELSVISQRKKCENAVRGNIAIGDFITKWYGTKPNFVSYGGVSIDQYGKLLRKGNELALKIAYIGRFESDTGLPELINATKKYSQSTGKNIELNLFGQGTLQQDIMKLPKDPHVLINISKAVSNTGSILEEYPIIFASGYLTILESLCARRIVFAYYNNPLREDYLRFHPAADSMFICGNTNNVFQGLKRCIDNIEDVYKKCEPGWQWAREQTWDKLAQQYVDLWSMR